MSINPRAAEEREVRREGEAASWAGRRDGYTPRMKRNVAAVDMVVVDQSLRPER
jgi:hypothetical protein